MIMKKKNNIIWDFFASVKLALFTLFILAVTSIIGTVIPQGKAPQFYAQQFGEGTARLFQILDIPEMYSSWWFLSLLMLFSLNLIICTFDRLPNVWRVVVQDNLSTDPERLSKMPDRLQLKTVQDRATATRTVSDILSGAGWKPEKKEDGESALLFSQKGAWSRLGVYIVHSSILIIFAGAIIGTLFGIKGSVMIPEGRATDAIYEFDTRKAIPLGFQVRNDRFAIEFYQNGTPKEFTSDLTVIDPARDTPYQKTIEVNDPMDYNGFTFYQSSYEAMEIFETQVKNLATGTQEKFQIPPGKQIKWQDTPVVFGIINMQQVRTGFRLKVWFSDGKGEPSVFWMNDGANVTIQRPENNYEFSARQLFATGLQVTKDPGVWTVYIGCTLMLLGLYIAFFLSHRRVWAYLKQEDDGCSILISGTSNKNRYGFEKEFASLLDRFRKNENLSQK